MWCNNHQSVDCLNHNGNSCIRRGLDVSFQFLSDASDKNYFDIEKYLSTHLKTKPEDVYEVFEVDASDEVATA